MGEIIKTTARFQEAEEPLRQKPIIQVDRTLVSLPNTIRASIDTGRDNPFRPDGAIYKSADPIVDYYKFGPNQSRAQSPTDSQLLLNANNEESNNKKSKKKRKKRKRDAKGEDDGSERPACWRRWFCCCCRCFRCCRRDEGQSAAKRIETASSVQQESAEVIKSDALPESTPATKTAVKLPDIAIKSTDSQETEKELEQIIEETRMSAQQVKGGGGGGGGKRSSRCIVS